MTQPPGLKLSAERIAELRKLYEIADPMPWAVSCILDDLTLLSSAYRELAAENERLKEDVDHFRERYLTTYNLCVSHQTDAQAFWDRADRAEQALARAGEVTEARVATARAAYDSARRTGTPSSARGMRAALTAALAVKPGDK